MSLFDKLSAQLPFGKKEEKSEYFLALIIGLSELSGVVWEMTGREINILGSQTFPYSGSEDLLEKSFEALDKAVGALEIEPKKILFGVPDEWGVEDNLKEPYLKLLRKILKDGDLEPLAYVTSTNAVAYLLQKQEGVPPTAILLGLGDFVEITLLRGGKTTETRSARRSAHLFEDIENILQQFTEVEVLPSKILLYAGKSNEDLDKLRDDLMSYPWMQRLSFLHFPKIEVLAENIAIESVIWAAASEINPDVNLKHSFIVKKQEEVRLHTKTLPPLRRANVEKDEKNMGFVKGDVKEIQNEEDTEGTEGVEEKMMEKDEEYLEDDNLITPDFPEEKEEIEEGKRVMTVFNQIRKRIKLPAKMRLGKWLVVPAILAAVVLAYLFLVKADVTVFVEPKILDREAQVIADPSATSISEEKKIIPGKLMETTVTGTDKETASGSKQIGDPARGKVVIRNKTAAVKSFSQGTVLTDTNNLKFTLDKSVQIASKSASTTTEGESVTWGKSEPVGITASVIGPEGNLLGGVNLTISGFSQDQFVARVEEALSGGTSKDVTVVTADDQKRLKAKVTDALRQKAEEELKGKTTDGRKVVADAFTAIDGKYTFSKGVNDQAKEFTLSATIRFKGISYLDSDLRTIVSKLVNVEIPEGYGMDLRDTETSADVTKVDKDGKLVTFKAKFRAKLLPKLNLSDIKNKIRGKSVESATSELKDLEGVIGSDIQIAPPLPAKISRLPILPQNINITVTPK